MQSCHREASKHETRYSHIRYFHYHGAGTVDHSDLAQLALETADHGTHHPTVVRPRGGRPRYADDGPVNRS